MTGRIHHGNGALPTVGVIDSGWNRAMPHSRVLSGAGCTQRHDGMIVVTDDDHDRIGHGTACAELILALAPRANVIPIRIFEERLDTSPAMIGRALEYAMERGIRLLNLSLGTVVESALAPLYALCARAAGQGAIIVAASGPFKTCYPASFDIAISVGVGDFGEDDVFSYEPDALIECLARGDRYATSDILNRQPHRPSSSFAAPRVTALLATALASSPQMTLGEARAFLARTSITARLGD